MARHHPILALCSNGSKIQAIATERYPSWASTHIKKRSKSSDAVVVSSGIKRKITKLSNAPPSEPPADLSSPPSDHLTKRQRPKIDETDSMTLLAAPDSTVSTTMATTLLTSPTDSDHSSSESKCVHATSPPPEVILQDTQDDLYSMTSLPQIKNPLCIIELIYTAKLGLSTKPNTSSPVPAPSVNSDSALPNPEPTASVVLSMAPTADDTILPTPGPVTGLQRKTEGTVSTCVLDMLTDCFILLSKNLCAHRWLKIIAPNGTSGDFRLYWNALSKDSQLNYEREAAALVNDGTWTGNAASTINKLVDGPTY
ncbi:hypothetical protein BDR07DRAFT_1488634 [Suillus spraguei]|nr:hypothetical protein BDR07DRAFT_1488634 [Suillus spraguei]